MTLPVISMFSSATHTLIVLSSTTFTAGLPNALG